MKRNQGDALFLRRWLPVLLALLVFFLFLHVRDKVLVPSWTASSSSGFPITAERTVIKPLPRVAYLISGTKGDAPRVKRLLQAVYHPRNCYLLHLDLDATDLERLELAKYVKTDGVLKSLRNAMVVGEADLITDKGPTALASMLHAVAILLQEGGDWDWFINLSASDYPLMSQDDILHVLSYLPRDLNFIEHTSDLGWREYQRARPLIVDPGLSISKKSTLFWTKEKRALPFAFKLFAGSEWVVLTKSFLEFCIWGWDNLPRLLLMYYTNYLSSKEGYFHTVICNHRDYQNTTINHHLRFQKWNTPPEQQPIVLSSAHFEEMVESGNLFARPFAENDEVLDKIDRVLLGKSDGMISPGKWCVGEKGKGKDPCVAVGNPDAVSPTVSSKRFEKLLLKLLDADVFRSNQCK